MSPTRKSATIDRAILKQCKEDFVSNPAYRLAMNAVSRGNLNEIALNREALNRAEMVFSIDGDAAGPITDQARSGTCWLFGGLNWLRTFAKKKMKVKEFRFSENYALFWDKLEKANYFFEKIIDLRDRDLDDRRVHFLLENPSPDGGEWIMVVNVIQKYGALPNGAMPCTFNRINSRYMNFVLNYKLREGAAEIRARHRKGAKLPALREIKDEYLKEIYRILTIHLGEPPDRITWAYKRESKGKRKKKAAGNGLTRFNNVTPEQFYDRACGVDLDDIHVLISAPMSGMSYYRPYSVEYFNNMIGAREQVSLNIPPAELKKIAVKVLKDGDACLFGCEVRLDMHNKEGLLDTELFHYDLVFDTTFEMDKKTRLDYHQARMTHSMVFTGVDLVKGKPVKWKVENSWGEQFGKKGYFLMNDNWFDEHVFEVVVPRKYLSKKMRDAFRKKPVVLPPWSPLA